MALDLSKIISLPFPEDQYFKTEFPKKQIVLHHTASGRGTDGDFRYWLNTPQRIATSMIIDFQGEIYQCFSSCYWGHHLGIKGDSRNTVLNQKSIALEIDAWGGLVYRDGHWWTYVDSFGTTGFGTIVSEDRIIKYPNGYRGFEAFEKYTDAQIESVRDLLIFLNHKYNIPLMYNEDMWDISINALGGTPGVWTHNSFRTDKSDCHPQPSFIKMLKTL